VEVAAANGVVTLYGVVDGPADKERIALLALGVDGVRSVVNNLVVVRGS
jgi:osmotically-inducible protein OsmY